MWKSRVVDKVAALTERQRRFCDEYLIDFNGTQAYYRAGYSAKRDVVAANGSRNLLAKPAVQAYIQARQAELRKQTDITRDRVLQELAAIGFSDAADYVRVSGDETPTVMIRPTDNIPSEKRAALAGIKQGRYGIEIRLHDKLRALEQISRMMGYIREVGEHQPEGDNGLLDALKSSAGEMFRDEVCEIQSETDEGADMVDTSGNADPI